MAEPGEQESPQGEGKKGYEGAISPTPEDRSPQAAEEFHRSWLKAGLDYAKRLGKGDYNKNQTDDSEIKSKI